MMWAAILDFLRGVFADKANRDAPEVQALRREADREAARARSPKAAGL